MSTHHSCHCLPPLSVSVWAVSYCSYIQVYVSASGTCTNQPCIYTAAPFRLQKHGEHSLLWGLGCPTEGCRKKKMDGAKDGWVGHWLGTNPSSGLVVVLATARLTLFTPLHTLAVRAPCSRPCTLLLPHILLLSLFSVWELELFFCFFLCPFFFILTLYKCGHLLTKQVRESSKATLLAAVVLLGIVRQRSENKTRHRLQSCTLVHLYCGQ